MSLIKNTEAIQVARNWTIRFWFFGFALIQATVTFAAPGDILFEEYFNNNGDFVSDWSDSGSGFVSVNSLTFNSASNSLSINGGTMTVTSDAGNIDANVPGAELSVWVRRGDDSFSEDPDTGEDLELEYLNNSGTWVSLEVWTGDGTNGQIYTPTYTLPDDALYSNLQIRFTLADGDGSPWDFWHIDDVVVTETAPTGEPGACAGIFSNGVQSNSSTGSISLNQNATISGGSSELDTPTLNILSTGITCASQTCTNSGNAADSVSPTFPSFPGTDGSVSVTGGNSPLSIAAGDYTTVSIDTNGGELRFTGGGTTTLTSLTANNNNSIIEFAPGDYYIQSFFAFNGTNGQLRLSSAGSVRIFVGGTLALGTNLVSSDFVDNPIVIYAAGSGTLSNNVVINGFIYTGGALTMANNSVVNGGVSASDLVMQNDSAVVYRTDWLENSGVEDFCTSSTPLGDPIAEYQLEEASWSGAADEVLDSSGNGLHGRAVNNSALPTNDNTNPAISGDPGTCLYGQFDGTADGYIEIDDPGTGSLLDIADNFTVAVWIYPNAWPSSDLASIASKDENWEFHLEPDGQVRWWWSVDAMSSNSSIPLSEWHHIAITYDSSGEQIIYIDGVADATNNYVGSAPQNNDNIFIGTDLNFHSRRFNGFIDELRIYDSTLNVAQVNAVMLDTHPCTVTGNTLSNFLIDVGGGTASTCIPSEVTITARDASNATLTGYTGTVNLTTSTNNGDWSTTADPLDAQGTLTPGAADSGAATYAFEAGGADAGSITLELENQRAESLTITVEDPSESISATSATLTFSENAFVITSIDSLGSDVVAGRNHDFRVEMYQRDPSTGDCAVATNYNVADVKAWINRDGSDPSGSSPSATNNAGTDTETLPDSEPATADLNLAFASGVADFTLGTSDVGRYSLSFLDDGNSFSDQDIGGTSSTYTVRPFGFDVQALANPGATDGNGAIYVTAGTPFTIAVRAVAWSSAADNDDDGEPDNHDDTDPTNNADLTSLVNNPTLVSFGQEGETLTLLSSLYAPAAGTDPGIETVTPGGNVFTSFINGASAIANEVYYAEVGVIGLVVSITDGDYLNTGTTNTARAISSSDPVGRFYPANLRVTGGVVSAGCGFTYMDEPFDVSYSVTAVNTAGTTTTNYVGDFIKLDAGAGTVNLGAIDNTAPTQLTSRLTNFGSAFSWNNGVAAVTTTMDIERDTSPDGPYNDVDIGVVVTDTDSVTVSASGTGGLDLDVDDDSTNDRVDLGNTSTFFGRLVLSSAFGPETTSMPVNFLTEIWNGSSWETNTSDDCTAIEQSDITYNAGTGSAFTIDTGRTVTIGGGTTTGTYADDSGTTINFSSGDAGHAFTAPGAGNTGRFNVDVDITAYPWLIFDWDDDGDFTDDTSLPRAYYSFGSYRGHDRIIYWREVLD